MSQKISHPMLPGFHEVHVKSSDEIMESKVRLHFHKISGLERGFSVLMESVMRCEERIRELEEAFGVLYMKKTL